MNAPTPSDTAVQRGRLIKWNDPKGYGFIHPDDGSPDIFVHVSGFLDEARRPKEGDAVRYEIDASGRRPKAINVRGPGLPLPNTIPLAYGVGAFFVGLQICYALGLIRLWGPLVAYLAMSIITFGFYYVDKQRAEAGDWRLTETSLHVLEILGGWPGAVVALGMLRHKTRKVDFLVVTATIAAVHVGLWFALLALA